MFKHAHIAAAIKTLTGDVNIISILLQAVLWETPGLIPHLQQHIPDGSSDPSQPLVAGEHTDISQ